MRHPATPPRRNPARRAAARLALMVTVAAVATTTIATSPIAASTASAAPAAPAARQSALAERALIALAVGQAHYVIPPGHPLPAIPLCGQSNPVDVTSPGTRPQQCHIDHPSASTSASGTDTLTVHGTNLAGQPDTGDQVFVFNAANSDVFSNGANFVHGVATFSVPPGHYWAVGSFYSSAFYLDVLPQFTVSGSTTVHVAAKAATSKLTLVTPRPSVVGSLSVEIRHPSPAGPVATVEWQDSSAIFVSPTTQRPTVGTLQLFPSGVLSSPPGAKGTPYRYNLALPGASGLIPPQRHVIPQASLATVHASYFSDVKGTGGEFRFGRYPSQMQDFLVPALDGLPVPATETEYMTGNPAILWSNRYWQTFPSLSGGQSDTLRTYHAGERTTETWNAYPLHEGYNTNLTGAANLPPSLPSASRAGNHLTLDVTPFSDSTVGHDGNSGFLFGGWAEGNRITGHYEIGENGKPIATGNPLKHLGPHGEFNLSVPVSPHPGTVRFALSASGTGPLFPLSTASQTVWTWRSAPQTAAHLPAGWICANRTRSCALQPMLTLGYAVNGLSLSGSAPAGRQAVRLSVGHLQLASPVQVAKVAVWVSFDGGKTWHPASATRRNETYIAAFTAPAGAKVCLRTRASDTAGGTITETLINAYRTGN